MIVNIGSTSKRRNSTLRPNLSKSYNCTLKEGCSVLNPTIRIDRAAINGSNFNYAYIPDFGRYYWITDIRFSGALVYIDLAVDVLATYKAVIGEKDLYITRSSSESDGTVVDTYYPSKSEFQIDVDSLESFSTEPSCFVVGFIGRGSTQYWAMDYNAFYNVLNFILSDEYADSFCGEFMQTVNPNIKAMLDPLQYISVVKAFPINLASGGTTGATFYIGPVEHTFSTGLFKNITNPMGGLGLSHVITFKQHPQASDRGIFLNGSLYSNITLYTPFGPVQLDGVAMAQASANVGVMSIDAFTGEAIYTIISQMENGKQEWSARISGKIGVDVPISQIITGGVSLTSAVSAAASVAGATMSMNPIAIGTRTLAASGSILDAMYNAFPKQRSQGSQGTYAGWASGVRIEYEWRIVTDDFNEDRGRPLCKVRKPKDIPGYLMAADPDVAISGTEAEASEVNSMLAYGIFYE